MTAAVPTVRLADRRWPIGPLHPAARFGMGMTLAAGLIFWLSNMHFDATRGDFFYLADAFLHGRVWLDVRLGFQDVIVRNDQIYVPFAPFPAIALMPIVAVFGPVIADQWETGINAALAATCVGLGWWFCSRVGVKQVTDRIWLVLLLGFSTPIWWITTRGGVWHTGQLIATVLTLACLIELWGARRGWLIGLLAGAAFLTRAPLAFAIPFYALLLAGDAIWELRRWPWRTWLGLALGVLPSLLFFFWYNSARFGSPLESGYGLALLPEWLEAQRRQGLFSTSHIAMNVDYLFLHLPSFSMTFPFLKPDGLGMSIFLTSPGLLYAIRAPWRSSRVWWLGLATLFVLVPTLLYYGGGWLQYGYRYALDSITFVWALCALAAALATRRREENGVEGAAIDPIWRFLIFTGVMVGALGVYWAYNLV